MNQIYYGLRDNLDISWYAKPEYTDDQMIEIRIGLKENLDVSKYANPVICSEQMKRIRLELLKESTL